MVAAPVTPWKPYMIEFMVLSVVTWVIPRLLVIDSVLGIFWIISDLSFLQALILFSSSTMPTLIACSRSGQRSTPEYGFHPVRPYRGDPSPLPQMPPWTTKLVRRIDFVSYSLDTHKIFQASRLSGIRRLGSGLLQRWRRPPA